MGLGMSTPSNNVVMDLTCSDDGCTQQRQKGQKRGQTASDDFQDAGGPSSSKPPRKKRAKAPKEPAPQRIDSFGRVVRWSPKASIKTRERMDRAAPGSAHRMFLINRKPADGTSQAFDVLGATGNVYTVTVGLSPHCTCPDHAKGNICKHIIFVMRRVLHRSSDDPLVWQKGLLPEEVAEVLSDNRAQDPEVRASEGVLKKYEKLMKGEAVGAEGDDGEALHRPITADDECPVCQEAMVSSAKTSGERVAYCFSCGNAAHQHCMQLWAQTRTFQQGLDVTCPFCRGPWKVPSTGDAAGTSQEGYINIGNGPAPTMESLYGARAVWVRAGRGEISRRRAAREYLGDRGLDDDEWY